MTDFDKKYLAITAGVEVLLYLAAKLVVMLLDLIPALSNEMVNEGFNLFKGMITPILLIAGALVVLGVYKNNRDGGGTI